MRKVQVNFTNKPDQISRAASPYTIYIGSGLLENITTLLSVDAYSQIVVLTDGNLPGTLTDRLIVPLKKTDKKITVIPIPPGEDNKTLTTVGSICEQMRAQGADRKSLILNFGGGVVGDMGGFIAGVYMRGIDFVQIPTTLLAQVDQSIGGKTGVDLEKYKNIVGLVLQPKAVIIDSDILVSLPEKQIKSGLVEIIKHGMILDKDLFLKVTEKDIRQLSNEELIEILARNAELKAAVISQDPTEKGLRKILNFGHTVGHAVESLSLHTANPLFHGEAISIGIIAEASISVEMGLLPVEEFHQIEQVLRKTGVPLSYEGLPIAEVRKVMQSDKKTEKGTIQMTLLTGIGTCVYNQTPSEAIIRKALSYVLV